MPEKKRTAAGRPPTLAKLQPPRIAAAIPRTGLLRRLDAERRRGRVVWIGAPAGWGKTTLAAAYAAVRRARPLWLRLDARDADPATFFHYLGEAAAGRGPRRHRALPPLTSDYALGLVTYAQNFFEELGALAGPRALLVLDNCQELPEDCPVHGLLAEGLRILPQSVAVLLLSRNEPPPAFAALRAARRLAVLDADALALSVAETRALATRYRFERLTGEAIASLREQARGWAAGTVLMLEEAARRRETSPSFDRPAARVLFDYFAVEVLQRAPEAYQKVLLESALLPEISADTARRLTGEEHAVRILGELAAKGYFVHVLAGREPTYQYHPLFREFLLGRLREMYSPDQLVSLYRRAAGQAEIDGDPQEALRLWAEAGAWDEMSRLIVKITPVMLEQGRGGALAAWIERVPPAVRERDPWTQLSLGQARLSADLGQARAAFESAYALFDAVADRAGLLLAAAAVVDSIVLEFGDLKRLDPWIERLERILGPNPEFPSPAIALRVTSSMAVALLFRRDRRKAMLPWLDRATKLLPLIPQLAARCRLAVYLSLDATWTGDLPRLERFGRDIAGWNRALHGTQANRLEMHYAKYVQTLYEWIAGAPDYGKTAALEALALVESSGIRVMEHHLVARAVFGALCAGEIRLAAELIDRLHELASRSSSARLHIYQYHYLPGWLALLSGDFAAALRCAEDSLRTAREAATSVFHRAFSACVAAYALLALGRGPAAAPHVERFLQVARQLDSPIMTFSGLLLQADLELAGDGAAARERGLKALAGALSLGRARGYRNTVVWYPAAIARCCAYALAHDIETDYAQFLVRERRLRPPANAYLDAWPWAVRIHTFGRFELEREGKAVRFEGRTQKRALDLLRALVAFGGRGVSEQRLCDALWPGAEADDARVSLKTTLHRLRALVGHESIVVRESKLSLDPEVCWVDVWAFERIANRLLEPKVDLSAAERAGLGERLRAFYRGSFLGDDGDAYALPARERLRSAWMRAIAFVAESLRREGAYDEALVWYERGVAVEPLAEPFYQGAMRVLLDQQRSAEGLAVYRRLRATLASQLQIAPSPDSEALATALRAPRPARLA